MADTRIRSGIHGLDNLIEGGFRDKTVVVVVGSSGTGKTTFTVQYILHGLEQGEQGLYGSLEESPEQIMREAELMGLDLRKHLEKDLFFIHLKGKNFKKMIEEQLPQLVKARADYPIRGGGWCGPAGPRRPRAAVGGKLLAAITPLASM